MSLGKNLNYILNENNDDLGLSRFELLYENSKENQRKKREKQEELTME